ncbi:MAG: DUF4271 domain-containing protein [Bacteroidia bacterium]|nr:DUF4271 domain-containing protein [Bacteroidia bacterium]MCF8426010.1 DUF4271 domain-containing protein [Bacteroidia bacterium]MCF8445395.1 DUF4271 domain-containing protein [Bacteroidia bacterium]
MRKLIGLLGMIVFLGGKIIAQNMLVPNIQTDSIQSDSIKILKISNPQNLLDSLGQPELIRPYFFLHEKIKDRLINIQSQESSRDLPRLKAIHLRKSEKSRWKFWLVLLNILFLALVRLIHIKRFDELMVGGFDTQIDLQVLNEKGSNYLVSVGGLFLNYVFAVSVYITTYLESKHFELGNSMLLFWEVILIILIVYFFKIVIQILIGSVFKMGKFSKAVLYNSFMVNNLFGVGLVLLNLFFVFVSEGEIYTLISAIILITIFVAVIFRQVKNLILTSQMGRFQFLHLFLYLCSLEILPWLVLFKLFLNSR